MVLWLLAVLECTEVMLEVTSELAVGEPGKWAVVILLQCVKATLRGILVFYMKSGLLTTPAVPSPDRKHAKVHQLLCGVYVSASHKHAFIQKPIHICSEPPIRGKGRLLYKGHSHYIISEIGPTSLQGTNRPHSVPCSEVPL